MTIEAPWPVPITPLHPVSCGVMLWRSRGQLYATVVVKVTFAMFDEADMVLEEPEPILRAELASHEYEGCARDAISEAKRHHQHGDMMHDAIRADVLSAILAARSQDAAAGRKAQAELKRQILA